MRLKNGLLGHFFIDKKPFSNENQIYPPFYPHYPQFSQELKVLHIPQLAISKKS
jgi:hypothetical protein